MNEEFNELFDIKDEEIESYKIPTPKQNVFIHSSIRVVVLIVTIIGVCAILFIAALDAKIELGILGAVIILGWFGLMIFETVRLNKKNCRELANANIVLIILAMLIILGITANVL